MIRRYCCPLWILQRLTVIRGSIGSLGREVRMGCHEASHRESPQISRLHFPQYNILPADKQFLSNRHFSHRPDGLQP